MYDKSKKTWSQRLKISKSERNESTATATSIDTNSFFPSNRTNAGDNYQTLNTQAYVQSSQINTTMHLQQALQLQQLNEYHAGVAGGYVAEPWLYGTIRGIPARPYHHHYANFIHPSMASMFPADASTVAVVICSCPEYLNGTKRDVKKASVCKKCKGSRLPLTTLGGTVRLPTSPNMAAVMSNQYPRNSGAATMRVVSSSKKSRPTILDPHKDPYDLMRRTRLLSPEPTDTKDKQRNQRGKSVSPTRGRSRTRSNLPLVKQSSKFSTYSSKSSFSNDKSSLDDSWLTEDAATLQKSLGVIKNAPTTSSRSTRPSILKCNVNPYDLISVDCNKKTPEKEDIKVKTSTSAKTSPTSTQSKNANFSMPSNSKLRNSMDSFRVEDAALYEDFVPLANENQTLKSFQTEAESSPKTKAKINTKTQKHLVAQTKSTDEEQPEKDDENKSKVSYPNVKAIAGQRISIGEDQKRSFIKQFSLEETKDKNCKTDELNAPKRPIRSKTTGSVKLEDTSNSSTIKEKTIKSILKRPSSHNESTENTDDGNKNGEDILLNSTKELNTVTSSSGTSQFYIPLPIARKKVQFVEKDNIIHAVSNNNEVEAETETETETAEHQSEESTTADDALETVSSVDITKPNYEYYNKQQEQAKRDLELSKLEEHSQDQFKVLTALQNDSYSLSTNETSQDSNSKCELDNMDYEDVLITDTGKSNNSYKNVLECNAITSNNNNKPINCKLILNTSEQLNLLEDNKCNFESSTTTLLTSTKKTDITNERTQHTSALPKMVTTLPTLTSSTSSSPITQNNENGNENDNERTVDDMSPQLEFGKFICYHVSIVSV